MTTKFLNDLQESRTVREFSPDQSVDVAPILESIRLAPTAYGIQPFIIRVISKREVNHELYKSACPQKQVCNCSHVLVFEARTDAKAVVDHYIKARNLDEVDRDFASTIRCHFHGMSAEEFRQFATNQIYISLGFALAAANSLGMGACPVGDFDSKKVSEVLRAHPPKISAAKTGEEVSKWLEPESAAVPIVLLTLGNEAESTLIKTQTSTTSSSQQQPASSQEVEKKSSPPLPKFRLSLDEMCTHH